MTTLFGLKSCDSCRKAERWLRDHGVEYTFHDVRNDGVSVQLLEHWADALGWESLLNKRSLTWRRIPEVDREPLGRNKAIAMMLEHPTLIRRPVLETRLAIAVGFSPAAWQEMKFT
jgi:arsenate reductase